MEAGSEVDHVCNAFSFPLHIRIVLKRLIQSDSVMQSAIAQVFTHHELLDQCGEIKFPGDMNVDDDAKFVFFSLYL